MKIEKQWIFLVAVILLAAATFIYFQPAPIGQPAKLSVTAYPEPAKIGYATIRIDSTLPLREVFVLLPDRAAEFDYSEGNSHFFKYFVSPYDEIGLKEINAYAVDASGNRVSNTTQGLFVGYNAPGDKYNGVIFYSYYWQPTQKALEIAYYSGAPKLFFEVSPEAGEGNQEVINAFVPLVTKLAADGMLVESYGVETDGDWLSCTNEAEETISAAECEALLDTHSIVLRYPRYPTTQVFIDNSTIDIMPAPGEAERAINATIALLNHGLPYLTFTPAVDTNATGYANSTAETNATTPSNSMQ